MNQDLVLMSDEQLQGLHCKREDDQSIKGNLKAEKSSEGVAGIAYEYDYEFTTDKIAELSEDELEGVADREFSTKLLALH